MKSLLLFSRGSRLVVVVPSILSLSLASGFACKSKKHDKPDPRAADVKPNVSTGTSVPPKVELPSTTPTTPTTTMPTTTPPTTVSTSTQTDSTGLVTPIEKGVMIPDGIYKIVNFGTKTCVDIPYQSQESFVAPWSYECNGSVAQLFKIVRMPTNGYQIINLKSGMALQIHARKVENGAQFEQIASNADVGQQFAFDKKAEGRVAIRNLLSQKVFDIQNGNAADGTILQQWDYNTDHNAHQQWILVPKDSDIALKF